MRTIYFLFGDKACDLITESISFQTVMDFCEETQEFSVLNFEPGTSPKNITKSANGWSKWVEITKEQYEKLSKL